MHYLYHFFIFLNSVLNIASPVAHFEASLYLGCTISFFLLYQFFSPVSRRQQSYNKYVLPVDVINQGVIL